MQGVYVQPGARAELRYEYLNQDQPRAGSQTVEVGEIPAHHDEVSTLNQALFATFDYNWASGWGVSAIVPVIKREHEHIHNHHGDADPGGVGLHRTGRHPRRRTLSVPGRGGRSRAKPQTVGSAVRRQAADRRRPT